MWKQRWGQEVEKKIVLSGPQVPIFESTAFAMFADIRTYEEVRATSLSDRVKLIEIGRTMVSPEVAAQAGVLAAKHASGAKVRPVFVPVCVP